MQEKLKNSWSHNHINFLYCNFFIFSSVLNRDVTVNFFNLRPNWIFTESLSPPLPYRPTIYYLTSLSVLKFWNSYVVRKIERWFLFQLCKINIKFRWLNFSITIQVYFSKKGFYGVIQEICTCKEIPQFLDLLYHVD